MSILLTIQLGYLNLPFIIKRSIRTLVTDEEDEDEERIKPRWPFSQTMLSLSGFIQTLPHLYPTLENHILQLAPQSKQFEKETIRILSETFKQSSAQNGNTIHGVIPLDHELFGILSSTEEPTVFTLQIIEHVINTTTTTTTTNRSYTSTNHNLLLPTLERCIKPVEMVEICQRWPQSEEQLIKIAGHVYQLASLYGYWDYWRIFEGVCSRFQINAEQLVNKSNK